MEPHFEWSEAKNRQNNAKHGVTFDSVQYAFNDPNRIIALDHKHSTGKEQRYFCYGIVNGSIATVRFTMRGSTIRIFGAGFWRSGKRKYYEKNKLH